MRLIDADAFKTWIDEYVSVFKKSDKAEIKGYISHQPSIDIVRCKECRWGKPYSDKQLECDALGLGGLKFPDDFCSYGQKGDENEYNFCPNCGADMRGADQ